MATKYCYVVTELALWAPVTSTYEGLSIKYIWGPQYPVHLRAPVFSTFEGPSIQYIWGPQYSVHLRDPVSITFDDPSIESIRRPQYPVSSTYEGPSIKYSWGPKYPVHLRALVYWYLCSYRPDYDVSIECEHPFMRAVSYWPNSQFPGHATPPLAPITQVLTNNFFPPHY